MSGKTKKTALVGVMLCFCVVVCLTITDRTVQVAAAADGSMRTAQAERTLKNIQVLKGLPASQMFLVMNFVATSLGVNCNFCHVQQGKDPNTGVTKWVW